MPPRPRRRPRPAPPPPPPLRYGTYTVIGPHAVLGKRRGEQVELEVQHAARLRAAGHVEPTPAPEPDPPPKKTAKKPDKPRQAPGLSAAQDSAGRPDEVKE
ncbi:hypothetical protein AB0I72_19185 [Nocardiopsis sp. NPDC049922]|uniref:hypothetical protein n=1 Tax=Nocardiopsis sp. NPDC049922 TaxID=3155157 RepID=UPI0033D9A040